MTRRKTYSKLIWLLALQLVCSAVVFAQVKIGNNPTQVNPNAILEIESQNKGLLLPRLALVATSNPYPLSAFVEGMLVYDTATVGDIVPGIYYSDGSKWIRLGNGWGGSSSGSGTTVTTDSVWRLTGNSGTSPLTHFIGTNDKNDLVFKTNGVERLRLTQKGWVGIGTATPEAALHVKGQVVIDTLETGDILKDSVVVASPNGKLRVVAPSQIAAGVKKAHFVVSITGQKNFETPAPIGDPDKLMLYRNGVMIGFNVLGPTTIESEIATVRGDEIKIVQIL
jgi:hypothetical protein